VRLTLRDQYTLADEIRDYAPHNIRTLVHARLLKYMLDRLGVCRDQERFLDAS
jgi:hypothetical protein